MEITSWQTIQTGRANPYIISLNRSVNSPFRVSVPALNFLFNFGRIPSALTYLWYKNILRRLGEGIHTHLLYPYEWRKKNI
jgi:hypothetical protein